MLGRPRAQARCEGQLDLSLSFFSSDGAGDGHDKYRLVFESAQFADRHDFAALWTPERHFKSFGGLFPNPSVLTAALAMITERIQLRAGSVVLPLHNALRVAEEWSVVDNISGGRVGVAFASGWHPDDFVLAAPMYAQRREEMYESIDLVRRLWGGGSVRLRNGSGREVETRIFPNPIQKQLPVWLTAMGEPTFVRAGMLGANVLTGLMEHDLESCGRMIRRYRSARAEHGFDPDQGVVTMMVHTFVGADLDHVKSVVRAPIKEYLRSFLEASEDELRSSSELGADIGSLSAADRDALLEHAFERYFHTRSLLGTPASCQSMLARLAAAGVDEVACLLDFGLDVESVLAGLDQLKAARDLFRATHRGGSHGESAIQ